MGTKYRSGWEVEVAKIFIACGVNFEYEKLDEETKTRPDFYISSLEIYLEIHPDVYGEKVCPKNCILVKELAMAKAVATLLCYRVNKNKTREYIMRMNKIGIKGLYLKSLDIASVVLDEINRLNGKSYTIAEFWRREIIWPM